MTTRPRDLALTVITALALITASCGSDDSSGADPESPEVDNPGSTQPAEPSPVTTPTGPPATPTTEPEPAPDPILVTGDALEAAGWWDYASGIVGVAFDEPDPRARVVGDVLDACAWLTTGPGVDDFATYVAELERIATTRGAIDGRSLEPRSYAIALDAALDLVCPEGEAGLASLRPAPRGVDVDDAIRGSTVIVPDPDPGDLRVDPGADVLPADYRHREPARTLLDLPYHDDPAQTLDLFLPATEASPLIVYLHSGGWVGGDKQFVPEIVMRVIEEGYAVASVNYRLAPQHRFPAQVQDVKHAIRWLKAYGAREGSFDPDRVVLVGASAGGHLAAFAAATSGDYEPVDLTEEEAGFDDSVVGVVSMVGPTDLVDLSTTPHPWAATLTGDLLGCGPCTDEQLREASPIAHIHPNLPPAYWAYGEDDDLVRAERQGVAIATAWGEAGGLYSSWLDLVGGRGHNMDHTTINQRWLEAFIAFVTTSEPFLIG